MKRDHSKKTHISENIEHEEELQRNALSAIRKKLLGKKLNYKEIYAVMDQIADQRLSDVLTTYFAASGYSKGFSNQEIYYLTKAMVETGDRLHFKGIVADKHSIGGVPGTRTTLIVVPIIAAAGFTIPKSSSRAITTPGGTADDMEVLSKVEFTKKKIYAIIKKAGGCIVWGGSFHIAPADDIIIRVEEPLLFESYDKIIVSIMAKKIAFGSNHIVIDLPYGTTVKVHRLKDAQVLKEKFEYVAKRFNVKIKVLIHRTDEPAGRGIGPTLETREAIRVLQQTDERPIDLEIRSLNLAGTLLDICIEDLPKRKKEAIKKIHGNGFGWATSILRSGAAFEKMKEIVKAQNGNPKIDSEKMKLGKYKKIVKSIKNGVVVEFNSVNATLLAKLLGAPVKKRAGIYIHKKLGENVKKGEPLFTLYSESKYNLKEAAQDAIISLPVVEIR